MVNARAARPARSARRTRVAGPVLTALLRQRRRLVLAGIAIALGVGYLAGALGLLERISNGLDDLATASADAADLVIEGDVAYESAVEQVRRLVPSTAADTAASTPGVASASHRIEDIAMLVDRDGEPVVAPGLSEQPLGVNWPEDPAVSALGFLEGGPPTATDEVAIDARSAQSAGVGVGDDITVAGAGKVGSYRIAGVIDPDAARLPEGSSLAVLTTDEARVVFDRPVDDNRVAIRLEADADPAAVADALRAQMTYGIEVVDGATAAEHQQEGLTRSFALVRYLVSGFAILALLVGMLTVANSLHLLHSERRHLYASFRLAGARSSQLRRAAFGEAILLALVASAAGIPLGVLLAMLIERALGALGTAVPAAGAVLSVRAALLAVGVGLLATMLAAWHPIRRACQVPPIEALRPLDDDPATARTSLAVWVSRGVITAAGTAAVALVAGVAPLVIVSLSVAAFVVVLLLAVVPRLLTRAVTTVISLSPFRPAPLRRIAARDAARNPRRTAATTASMLFATAVIAGLAVFLQSFTASVDAAVDDLVTADLVVDSGTFTRGGLPGDLVARLGEVSGVQAASGWQLGRGSAGGYPVRMTGIAPEAALEVLSPGWVGTAPTALSAEGAWISSSLAERIGVAVGDTLPLLFTSGGTENLRVEGLYGSGQALLGDIVLDGAVVERQVPATPELAALLRTDGSSATTEAVTEIAASYGITSVLSPEEFVQRRSELLDGFQRVIQWMLVFTLLQALVGVVNTLVMSVGERRREFGLLRVSGASRRQVLQMVLFEGASLAFVGAAFGIAAGTFAAWAAVTALASLGLGVFSMPFGALVILATAAMAVGVGAAVIPARMAASVPPVEAVLDSGAEFTSARGPAASAARPPAPVPAPASVPAPAPAPAPAVAVPPPYTGPIPGVPAAPVVAPAAPAATGDDLLAASLMAALVDPPAPPVVGDPAEVAALQALMAQAPAPAPPQPPEQAEPAVPEPVAGTAVDEPAPVEPGTIELPPVVAEPVVSPFAPFANPAPVAERPAVEEPAADELVEQGTASDPDRSAVEESEPAAEDVEVVLGPAPGQRDVPPPDPEVDSGAGRRARLRRSASRVPRRRQRRDAASSPADGWVLDAPASADRAGASDVAGAAAAPSDGVAGERSAEAALTDESLADAIRRLEHGSVLHGAPALTRVGAVLAPGERVAVVVCGSVRGWPTAVVRTDRRLLVVVEREDRAVVESLHPVATGVVVRRPPGAATVSVAVFDRGRVMDVDGIAEEDLAEALVLRDALHPA